MTSPARYRGPLCDARVGPAQEIQARVFVDVGYWGMAETPKPLPRPTLTEQVMDYVRGAVASGEIVAGAWYSVQQLSEVLGISRSPVRDGLLRLEESGLIQFTANRGFQIVSSSPEDIAEIYALRLGIEVPAARRAARQRNVADLGEIDHLVELMSQAADIGEAEEFFRHERALHDLILRLGHSERGARLVAQLRPHTRLIGREVITPRRSLHHVLQEFDALLVALREQDQVAAGEAMRNHLCSTGMELLQQAVELNGGQAQPRQIWKTYTSGL
ncbi:putative HTH-type transcriptional regulator YdfH [Corynebacterium occultum]|uniref:Putative HTH-type transcriptional regulator YdfH n=1 Tax=Corynebacterium occultum TaxID=2675219 RepID=A0A6B8VUV1_9CORY|nr:GntR family transcriptional regulator [Corynebacterium occultum]QGU07953.1 putative HTH-type transcriptional regulator YdfH [Corynebacterium occultum]